MLEKRSGYETLAAYYDAFQEDSDLQATVAWILDACDRHMSASESSADLRLADLGCGTGSLSVSLAAHVFQISAVDQSSAMLRELNKKRRCLPDDQRARLQVIEADIVSYRFQQKQDILLAVTDSLNHVPAESMQTLFQTAAFNLRAGGLFVFDLLHESFLATERGNHTFFSELPADAASPTVSMIWENRWDEEKKTAISDLTFFEKRSDTADYVRSTERIVEYYHDLNTVPYVWQETFESVDVRDETDRRLFVLRRR